MTPEQDLSGFSMLDLFRMEAQAQARVLTAGLLALEEGAGADALEPLMRAAHSLKGAAAIVGLDALVQLAHAMEDAFVAAQRGGLRLGAAHVDALLAAVDLLVQASTVAEAQMPAWLNEQAGAVIGAIDRVRDPGAQGAPARPATGAQAPAPAAAAAGGAAGRNDTDVAAGDDGAAAPPQAAPAGAAPARPDERRAGASAARPDDQLLALASESRILARQLGPVVKALHHLKRQQSALGGTLDRLHELLSGHGAPGPMAEARAALGQLQPIKQALLDQLAALDAYERRQATVASALVDEVLALRMRPFGDGVHAFPRMVRDLARTLGKQVRLRIEGASTPVDRAILARIESPLTHLLRNALDHGLEEPAARAAAGKDPCGTLVLAARHRAGMLVLELRDDGRGIDSARIRARIVERGMASAPMAAALSHAELLEFLFLPAFTLRDAATELSGRGVGLDLVAATVRGLNGHVRIDSVPGAGFTTTITLPLTQSIVRAVLVEIAGEAWALPIAQVAQVVTVERTAVHSLENKQFFRLGDEHVGLVPGAQVLGLPDTPADGDLSVIVLGSGSRRYGLVVDAVRGEASLVVQPLEPVFGHLQDVAAGALLDDGAPVLVLDVADLLLSIDKLLQAGALQRLAASGPAAPARARRVLVVDDSLTVREMQRQLLVTRGYQVEVAVDGSDGWNMVRRAEFDLVITDVDMPRMDGIELVGRIRAEPRLARLPVLIVSYKDRPEDRARGLNAGADYYLTKGAFHDATLLDAVADLIGEAQA